MLYTNFGVDTVKIHRVDVTLLFLSLCKLAKKSVMADFNGPSDFFFFVDHIELDLCIQFQVYGVRGMAFLKLCFLTATPPGKLGSF